VKAAMQYHNGIKANRRGWPSASKSIMNQKANIVGEVSKYQRKRKRNIKSAK
jgi:hypothetical protein